MANKKVSKKKRSYSKKNVYKENKVPLWTKLLILFLSLATLGGVGYIVYDILKSKEYFGKPASQISKKLQIKEESNLDLDSEKSSFSQTNLNEISNSNSLITNGSKVPSEESTMNGSKDVMINSQVTKGDIETNKTRLIDTRLYIFSVKGDSIVMDYENVSLDEENLVYKLFKRLKEVKSTDRKLSFVNSRVRLIDYKVSGETLFLNLSKDVEYNEYGGEGVLYSIYQIAFTLGKALKVNKVLILIDGEEPSYLGGEGIVFQNPIDITKPPRLY